MHVRAVYTYVYKDTYSVYFENIYMYLHVHIISYNLYYIKYLIYKYNIFVLNIYMHACVCLYILGLGDILHAICMRISSVKPVP